MAFVDVWNRLGGGDLPDPNRNQLDDVLAERIMAGEGGPADYAKAISWWTLEQWEMAAVAVLSRRASGRRIDPTVCAELLASLDALSEHTDRDFKCLRYALLVLDDADIVVLDRPTGAGFRVRVSGIGDNFQLHTLLADTLIGGGHLPGTAPSKDVVALSIDRNVALDQRPVTVGAFNLVAPDGNWIWNEGTPSDIPVVDGPDSTGSTRLLVLDPPPYQRSWPAGRFFPNMPASMRLLGVLSPDEATSWFSLVKPSAGPNKK